MNRITIKTLSWLDYRSAKLLNFIFYFPLLVLIILLVLKVGWNDIYKVITKEDHLLENAQFFGYFIASICTLFTFLKYKNNNNPIISSFLLIIGIILMFISMEEISWGERLFTFKSSELDWIKEHNAQGETTIHNLRIINNKLILIYALGGFFFSFGWIPVKYFSFFRKMKEDLKSVINLFSPRWYLMFYFIPTFLLYSYWVQEFYIKAHFSWYRWNSKSINNFLVIRDQESVEFLFAFGLLLYVISIMLRLRYASQKKHFETTLYNHKKNLENSEHIDPLKTE